MITLSNLVIGYKKPLLDPLNVNFEDGKIYGILGPSGCGKSTLLKTIARLKKPIAGKIIRNDNCQIYMMHQRYTNFNWLNCLENVLIAERSKRKRKDLIPRAKEVLEQVGLADYLDRYPTELSGGMQQRLALARVLFIKPKYLLMDEPLSALDDVTRARMQQLIKTVHNETGGTIIMVTHSVAEANRMCDQIITLTKGK